MKNVKLIGVVHLPALPGAPNAGRGAAKVVRGAASTAVAEAKVMEQAGFDGLILENFGDVPFFKDKVPESTVAAMSIIASEVREATRMPIGINVLRNDAHAALAIAAAAGCDFIRVNVLSGVAATDQGIIEGNGATLLRARRVLRDQGCRIRILADVLVKHANSLSGGDVELAIEEAVLRAGADGVILTGPTTGRCVDLDRLRAADPLRKLTPVYLGSGVTVENLPELAPLSDGVIVGSALRDRAKAGAKLSRAHVHAFALAWKRAKN